MIKKAAGLLGIALTASVLIQAPSAQAAPAVTYCGLALGAVSADGGHILRNLTATTPPTASASRWGGKGLLAAGQMRLAGGLGFEVTGNQSGMKRRQFVVTGEPVAVMGSGAHLTADKAGGTSQPVLYVEFRKDGIPVDPDPRWAASGGQKVRG